MLTKRDTQTCNQNVSVKLGTVQSCGTVGSSLVIFQTDSQTLPRKLAVFVTRKNFVSNGRNVLKPEEI